MRVSEHCYAVTGLGYAAPWCVNAGFVAGAGKTLIVDTGANALAAATIHGYALTARAGNVIQAINTEQHFDHVGGNQYLRERGIDVFGHAGIQRTAAEFRAEIEEFNAGIVNPKRRGEGRVFFAGTSAVNPNLPITDDLEMDLGGLAVQVLLTPGHTPTNLCVWVPEDQVLYTGDCLINGYMPNLDAGGPDEWRQWLDSLDRIEALAARTVVMGHGPVAQGEEIRGIFASVRAILRASCRC